MIIVSDTLLAVLHYPNIHSLMSYAKFLKNILVTTKFVFSCLVSGVLFRSETIKSYVLGGHLAFQRSSENIDPEETVDGILLDK